MHYSSLFQYLLHLKWRCAPQLSSKKWSIQYASLSAMFNLLRSISNQELFEKHLCNPRISKEMVPRPPGYINNYRLKSEVSITLRCQLCSTHYTAVQIKNCLKNASAIKVATMKNTDDFRYEGKPSRAITKLTLFTVSKDEWDTKEDTGKSTKKALHVLRYAKRHLLGRSDTEQWKNQARNLSCYQVTLVWRHQSVSQSVSYSVSQ